MKKALLALLGAVLLLAGVFGVKKARESLDARPRLAFADARLEDAVRLGIRYAGDSVTLALAESGWIVTADSFPADTARLRRAFGHLAELQTRERAADSADAEALVEYGLSPAEEKVVEWETRDGRVRRAVLGKISGIDFGSVFWKYPDAPEVYRTPGKFVWDFPSRAVDWKDTNLYHPRSLFREEDVRAVEVEWRAEDAPAARPVSWRLERSDTGFVLTKPFEAAANREEAGKIFRHVAQFKIDFFQPGEDVMAPYAGLDNPFMTVRVELADGSERTVTAGARVDGLYRYARHASHPAPVRVFEWRFEYFRKKVEDLAGEEK